MLFLTAAFGTMFASAAYRSMSVDLTDGTAVAITLSDDINATFTTSDMIIAGGEQEITIERAKITGFTFSGEVSLDRITPDTTPAINGSEMRFDSLPDGSLIQIITSGGAIVNTIEASGSASVSLSDLPAGVYIVTVNNISYKIAVR